MRKPNADAHPTQEPWSDQPVTRNTIMRTAPAIPILVVRRSFMRRKVTDTAVIRRNVVPRQVSTHLPRRGSTGFAAHGAECAAQWLSNYR